MGGIADEHVEWAVVNRLKAMLDVPPKTKFNVTQSFALFSAILLWTKQRAWVPDHAPFHPADRAARAVRNALETSSIFDAPWLLSRNQPPLAGIHQEGDLRPENPGVNADFEKMTAAEFLKWLRDALAHGDGRTIRPIHKLKRDGRSLLAGFAIRATARGDRERLLTLYHADMRRIGAVLADHFCKALSGGDRYFQEEVGMRLIEEAA
jgi:hypothetical protein